MTRDNPRLKHIRVFSVSWIFQLNEDLMRCTHIESCRFRRWLRIDDRQTCPVNLEDMDTHVKIMMCKGGCLLCDETKTLRRCVWWYVHFECYGMSGIRGTCSGKNPILYCSSACCIPLPVW